MESFQHHHEVSSGSGDPKEMQQIFLNQSLFSPFVVNTLKVQGDVGFLYHSACYNPKYNLIIACPSNTTMQFYDANTFEPCEKRGVRKLDSVSQMSFHPENDTYLLGCMSGPIYKYNVSKNELETLGKLDGTIFEITFLDSTFYAFSLLESEKLYVGNLNNGFVLKFDLNSTPSFGLHHLSKEKLLFTGLSNSYVKAFRTNKLPHLKAICSVRTKGWTLGIQSFNVNGKEYVVAAGEDQTVRIWHLVKGRVRLLKVIHNKSEFCSLICLENYKMIATSCKDNSLRFWRFPSMKLEKVVSLSEGAFHLFLVKEKNMIGVTNENESKIEFVQLHRHLQEK